MNPSPKIILLKVLLKIATIFFHASMALIFMIVFALFAYLVNNHFPFWLDILFLLSAPLIIFLGIKTLKKILAHEGLEREELEHKESKCCEDCVCRKDIKAQWRNLTDY